MTDITQLSYKGVIIWLLAAFFFLYEFFLRTFVGSLAHQIIPELHLTAEAFALMGSAYYLAFGVMQIPVGILSDKYSVKRLLVFAVFVCALATFLFAHATSYWPALMSRFLMGFGSSFAFICLLVVTLTWFPERFFGFFAGLAQLVGTMGPILAGGPLVAFVLHTHNSWQSVFIKISGVGLVLAFLMIFIIKDRPKQRKGRANQTGFLIAKFLRLLNDGQVWLIALYSGTVYCAIAFMGAIWGTEYLEVRGLSQAAAASVISLCWFSYAVACPVLGLISDVTRRRNPMMMLSALIGLLVTVAIIFLPTQGVYVYGLLFSGLGIAAAGQNVAFAAISEHVDITLRATALGFNNAMISVFDISMAPLAAIFIGRASHHDMTKLQPEHFVVGFSIMPTMYLVALIISLFFIKETYCQKDAANLPN